MVYILLLIAVIALIYFNKDTLFGSKLTSDELRKNIAELEKNIADIKQKLNDSVSENILIKDNILKVQLEKDNYVNQLLSLTSSNLAGNAEIKKLNDKINDKNQTIDQLQASLKISNDKIKQLQNEIADLSKRINDVKNDVVKKAEEILDLQKTLTENNLALENTKKNLENQIQNKNIIIAQIQADLNSAIQDKIVAVTQIQASLTAAIENNKISAAQAQAALNSAIQDKNVAVAQIEAKLSAAIQDKNIAMTEADAKLADAVKEKNSLISDLNNKIKDIANLNSMINSINDSYALLKTDKIFIENQWASNAVITKNSANVASSLPYSKSFGTIPRKLFRDVYLRTYDIPGNDRPINSSSNYYDGIGNCKASYNCAAMTIAVNGGSSFSKRSSDDSEMRLANNVNYGVFINDPYRVNLSPLCKNQEQLEAYNQANLLPLDSLSQSQIFYASAAGSSNNMKNYQGRIDRCIDFCNREVDGNTGCIGAEASVQDANWCVTILPNTSGQKNRISRNVKFASERQVFIRNPNMFEYDL
jgi:predicted  nucleic acid-binding Zn-ribbon protein